MSGDTEGLLQRAASAALNRLAKWRMVFAGWQLGTRSSTDPEAAAVRDHREVTLMMRAELNALLAILIAKDVLTMQDWLRQIEHEARLLDAQMSNRFPGMKSSDHGMVFTVEAAEWMTGQGWKP